MLLASAFVCVRTHMLDYDAIWTAHVKTVEDHIKKLEETETKRYFPTCDLFTA